MVNMFNTKLDEIDYKFLGLFFVLTLAGISVYLNQDLITGFLGSMGTMMGRDLYRSSTNKARKPE